MELSNLKVLDLRTAKKPVCKITPEFVDTLSKCTIRGAVIKKAKGGAKKK